MSRSPQATAAAELVRHLQRLLVQTLQQMEKQYGDASEFTPVAWLRGGGEFGGGDRYTAADTPTYNRASANVSLIHYDTRPEKALASATALSAIVHPQHPSAPSMHMHISWTEMRDGRGYWRIMADLNPCQENSAQNHRFREAVANAAGYRFDAGASQGDRYFYIPALRRHRGAVHFYLEAYRTEDDAADLALARRVGEAAIRTYGEIVNDILDSSRTVTSEQRKTQLAYHTLYLFQVLTLDRGTTSGLLVHNENDEGILASLPGQIDRDLLQSWADNVPSIQKPLVNAIVAALPEGPRPVIDAGTKRVLAEAVRQHYRANPEALKLQARGDVVPPTVANHGTAND
ncbi:MAG: coproporphyrinogen III oxidase [Myxococcota bacterium]